MASKMKLRRIGNSLGFTVPKDVLQELGIEEGDEFCIVRTQNGVELTRYDPDAEDALEVSRKVLRRYPSAMGKLADS